MIITGKLLYNFTENNIGWDCIINNKLYELPAQFSQVVDELFNDDLITIADEVISEPKIILFRNLKLNSFSFYKIKEYNNEVFSLCNRSLEQVFDYIPKIIYVK